MVFSHNATGGLFSSTSALSKNEDNPTANLYSILGQLKNVTSPDGYHLKLCYPELKGKSLGAGIKSYTQENKLRHLAVERGRSKNLFSLCKTLWRGSEKMKNTNMQNKNENLLVRGGVDDVYQCYFFLYMYNT